MAYNPLSNTVGYEITVLMELWCQLDFNDYPIDKQVSTGTNRFKGHSFSGLKNPDDVILFSNR